MNLKDESNKHPFLFLSLIVFVSIGLHWKIYNTELIGVHLWRQSETAINIKNFYRHDFNIMNPRDASFNGTNDNIMRYEFPIMQWLVAGAHKIFGESIIVMRVSMFIIGLLGVLGVFYLLKTLWGDNLIALLGAWAFNFSPIFYYYTMNPMPDVFALVSTIWSMHFFFRYTKVEKNKDFILSAFFLLLATLAKLPFVIFGAMVGAYAVQQLFKKGASSIKQSILIALTYTLFLLPAFFWYRWVIPTWGNNGVLKGIFDNGIPLERTIMILKYHATDLLPKLLLNYAAVPFFFAGIVFMFVKKSFKKSTWLPLAAAGLAVLAYFLLEYNMIEVVHDYYMLPFLPPLLVIVGYGIKELWQLSKITRYATAILLLALPLVAFNSVDNFWSIEKTYNNPDLLNNRELLRNAVPNNELCIILNDDSNYIFPYQIDKQGYIFRDDYLPAEWVGDIVTNQKVKYMYSNTRVIDERPDMQPFIDSLILQCGSIKVFKLKVPK